MTKSQYRLSSPTISSEYFEKIVSGAASFQPSIPSKPVETCRVLLLKRSVHEVDYPNVFELPSGNVVESDLPLKHALARKVKKEMGLDVTRMIAELPEFFYHAEKQALNADGKAYFVQKSCVQLNFVAGVEGDLIRVNPDEHSVGMWATRKDIEGLDMTDGMRGVDLNALTSKDSHTDEF